MRTILFVLIIFMILRYAWRMLGDVSGPRQERRRDNPDIKVDKAPDDKRYEDAEYVDYEEVD